MMMAPIFNQDALERYRRLLAALRRRWPQFVSSSGQRLTLADLCAYSIWSMAEESANGRTPARPSALSALVARFRRGGGRWTWRPVYKGEGQCRGWIYLPLAKRTNWQDQFQGPVELVLRERPDLGLLIGEEISSPPRTSPFDALGEPVRLSPPRTWRVERGAGEHPQASTLEGGTRGGGTPATRAAGEDKALDELLGIADRNRPGLQGTLLGWLDEMSAAMDRWPAALVMVVNDLERFRRGAAMLAQLRGVPVVNVQHGMINRSGHYTLAVADLHLLWGPAFADILADAGLPAASLRAVGAPHYDRFAGCPTPPPAQRPRVLYAAQPATVEIPADVCSRLVEVHADLARRRADMDVIIRLHPRTSGPIKDTVAALVAEIPNLRQSLEKTVDEALERCDVVTTVFSTVSIDAAALRRPTVLLDFAGEGRRFPLDRRPPFFPAATENDLASAAAESLQWARSPQAVQGWQEFDRRILCGLDGGAKRRSADALLEVLEKSCPR